MARKANKEKLYYVDNKKFSQAVVDYVSMCDGYSDDQRPVVPDYIAKCFMDIAEGLSRKKNFINYSFRNDMVGDAVENCLRAIRNYDIEAATRSGRPNAFAYFTQISWYAFLRRIKKEGREQDIKKKFLSESGIDQLLNIEGDPAARQVAQAFVDSLKSKHDKNSK